MRKFIPNIIFTAILIAFVIQDHKERESEALTPATDQLAPATYRGMFPAADCPGIDYTLTLNDSIADADTLFALRMVYIEGDNNGGDITFDSRGQQHRFGIGAKRGYRLMPDDGDVVTYFAIVNDTTLQMVDSTLTKIDSPFNYDLVRINQ
ncbi:MAG: copper resistance protein NlpE N-terminal domain-containing protein [Rikenellaceae bacterium]|nr:copper resistance protein NlpE N-terminal domain-containing protein [Rikenellaceae bacterium]